MFHDVSVSCFSIHGEELRIETEGFSLSPTETVPPARIIIAGSRCVHRNDVKVAVLEIESDDAEIYGLDSSSDGVRLHLIWNFWKPRASEVWCVYWFPGATLRTEALSGGPLVLVQAPSTQS